jgi:beta-N-acetylhexosaminidase
METRDLAAGVLLAGFNGITLSSGGALEELRSFPVGGVILLGPNVVNLKQTRALTDEIRSLYAGRPDPLIAIDQEGGRVVRLHDGVVDLPPMLALGATGDAALAKRAGAELGNDLRRAGVNMTCGPVLDLAIFSKNTVIGSRAFGEDPRNVARVAGAFAEGMRGAGIVTAFKHFPGHGSTALDSNAELPVIDVDAATLRARDLVPFAELLPHADAVMTAHIVTKAFDGAHPATTSPVVLNDLLRKELRFNGVCISDCMQMDAVTNTIGSSEGAIQALVAGVDCVLVSRSLALARAMALAITRAADSGQLPRARLEEAYARVLALRQKLSKPQPLDAPRRDPKVGEEIAARAITVVKGLPSANVAKSIVVSFEGTMFARGTAGLISRHYSIAGARKIPEIKLPLEPTSTAVDNALTQIEQQALRPIVLMRRAHIYNKQSAAIESILKIRPDALLVSMLEPYDAFIFEGAPNLLCAYGDDELCINALGAVIFDGLPARGKLPVTSAA